MLARTGELSDHVAAASLLPQPFKHQGRPDPSRRARDRIASGDGFEDNHLVGEARARSQQPIQLPALAQLVEATDRGDHLLAHRSAIAPALDDLQIGAAAGGLLAKIHGAEPGRRLVRGPHKISDEADNVNENMKLRGTTNLRNYPSRCNDINRLYPARGSKVLKISQEVA